MKELLKAFKENQDLGDKAKAMWSQGASAKEVADALEKAGLKADACQVEELLATLQADRAKTISDDQKVDRDQLKAIAGGECGSQMANSYHIPDDEHLGNCSVGFYTKECSATVEADSWCWSNDACALFSEQYYCVTTYD